MDTQGPTIFSVGTEQLEPPDLDGSQEQVPALFIPDACHDAAGPYAEDERQQVGARDHGPDSDGHLDRCGNDATHAAPPELAPVAPGGEFAALRPADANELHSFRDVGQPDIVGREALRCVVELALALLDRLPALVQR
jgi:hypothetical protein